jgi:hypothetical protein
MRILPTAITNAFSPFGTNTFAGDAGDEDDEAGGGRFLAGADGEVGGKADPFVFVVPPLSNVTLRFGTDGDEDGEGGTGGAAPPETPESDDEARNEDCTAAA